LDQEQQTNIDKKSIEVGTTRRHRKEGCWRWSNKDGISGSILEHFWRILELKTEETGCQA
jgi:hypothetical protein